MERRLILLGVLRQQEMHGYQLHEFINNTLTSCTDIKKPTAYYLLKKMNEEGLISQETTQEGNRPPRQVYTLTPKGEEELQRLLRENLSRHVAVKFSDDIGLAFLDAIPPQAAIPLLESRRQQIESTLNRVQKVRRHKGGLQLVIEHQKRFLESELAWIDEVINRLKEEADK